MRNQATSNFTNAPAPMESREPTSEQADTLSNESINGKAMNEQREFKTKITQMRLTLSFWQSVLDHQQRMMRMRPGYPSNFTEFVEVACEEKMQREGNN